MCYSSQHYFVQTIYVSGIAQVILGMQTLLWVKDYSCFADQAVLPLSALCVVVCMTLHQLCLWFGALFGIWKIDTIMDTVLTEEEMH